jgi:hypothetical protein
MLATSFLLNSLSENAMNGEYLLANPRTAGGAAGTAAFPVGGGVAPGFRGSYIDIYSGNITTVYSEVFWDLLPPVALPADFVAQFKGKTISITGYEYDSVRPAPGGGEISVPLYEQYNHHHNAYLHGESTEVVDVGPAGVEGAPSHGGMPMRYVPRPTSFNRRGGSVGSSRTHGFPAASSSSPPPPQIAEVAFIVDGNGGEYKKSRHGTAAPWGVLVHSPTTFTVQPMMINTRDPDSNVKYPFNTAGPTTNASLLPSTCAAPPNAHYSGLLECPCTDRKPKVITQHSTVEREQCADASGLAALTDAATCFTQVVNLGLLPITKNATVTTAAVPPGCSVRSTQAGYETTFNSDAKSTVPCGPANVTAPVRATGFAMIKGTGVSAALDLERHVNCSAPLPYTARDLSGAWVFPGSKQYPNSYRLTFTKDATKKDVYVVGAAGPHAPCAGNTCVGILEGATFAMTKGVTRNAIVNTTTWSSMTFSNTAMWTREEGQNCAGRATLTITGPAQHWFGLGLGATTMSPAGGGEGTYALIVDGGSGAVSERALGDHIAGQLLAPSWEVQSMTVNESEGTRTVVLTRALAGRSSQYFSFDEHAASVAIIGAVGDTPKIAYHKVRSGATLMLVEVGGPLCVCAGGISGSIAGIPFNNHCTETLLSQKNAVCDVRTYPGGLKCCAHKSILLDKSQTPPPAKDTYQMKFRIWYEEYTKDTPQYDHAFFMFRTCEEGSGEYDIPKCKKGTPVEECVYTTSATFKVRDSMHECKTLSDGWCAPNWNETNDVLLLRAGTHCHAPGCINETLVEVKTGKVICLNRPLYGKGIEPNFDELDYAAGIPPCIWGSSEEGVQLVAPPRFTLDTELQIIKHVNSTYGHYGVMAQWQMRGAWAAPL